MLFYQLPARMEYSPYIPLETVNAFQTKIRVHDTQRASISTPKNRHNSLKYLWSKMEYFEYSAFK